MTLRTIAVLVCVRACASTQAQLRPRDRFAITTDQVAAKLMSTFAQEGVKLDAKEVVLPPGVTSSEETPMLEIRSMQELHGSDSMNAAVKLSCVNVSVCLPFYAMVTLPGADKSLTALRKSQLLTLGNTAPVATVIKSGAHVTLLLERGTTHIQMGVISMENGGLHGQIKVRTADRKQIFVAEVLDPNTVKGTY